MAEIAGSRKITDLTEKTTLSDTDLLVEGTSGTDSMRKFSLSTLANWVKDKVSAFTFAFDIGTRTFINAINSITQGAGTVNYVHAGATYITTNAKDISFILTTNRVVPQTTRIVSVTPVAAQFRQNGSYLYNKGSSDDLSDLHISATKRYNGIQLSCTYWPSGATEKQAFPNATNNDVVGLYISVNIEYELQS